jgi:hypothetical protein
MELNPWVRPLFVVTFVAFVANKAYLRPRVLELESPAGLLVLVNSFPNFAEAVLGTLVLAGMAVALRINVPQRLGEVTDTRLFMVVSTLAAVFVVTQELGLHHLGGRNVTDPYDVVASVVGIVLMNRILCRWGLSPRQLQPTADAVVHSDR